MPTRLLIKNGLVVDPSQDLEAVRDVLIENRRIARIAPGLSRSRALKGVPVLDARRRWVTPGLIDIHVHLREPGDGGAETIASGTRAAALGGITTVLAMPNTRPPMDSPALLSRMRSKASREAAVNVLFTGTVTAAQKGLRLSDIGRLARAGAAALSEDGNPVMNAGLMREAMELARMSALPIIDHCEDTCLSARGAVNDGPAARNGERAISSVSETVMALRDIELAALTGARLHIAHVSAARTVEAIRSAKRRGIRVTGEAAPHHLILTDRDIPGRDPDFKMNPPLRSAADRDALLRGLADGTIDAIATDHAPHSPAHKAVGMALAPFGVIGLETSLGLVLTKLLGRVLSRRKVVERMSLGPARILNLKTKGSLKPGMDADLTVIDPSAVWTVKPPFASLSRNSPFIGMRLKGRAAATIVGGRVVHAL